MKQTPGYQLSRAGQPRPHRGTDHGRAPAIGVGPCPPTARGSDGSRPAGQAAYRATDRSCNGRNPLGSGMKRHVQNVANGMNSAYVSAS